MDAYLYIGTYSEPILMGTGEIYEGKGKGVYICSINTETGEIIPLGIQKDVPNVSYLEADSSGKYLYAVNELDTYQGKAGSAVTALKIEQTGLLNIINRERTEGRASCWLCLDEIHRKLAVANYMSGSLSVLGISEDGSIKPLEILIRHKGVGTLPERQECPHVHCAAMLKGELYIVTADLGIDRIHVYGFENGNRIIKEIAVYKGKDGSGPRAIVCHPCLPILYVVNELDSTVSVLGWDGKERNFSLIQTISTVNGQDVNYSDNLAAGIVITQDGKNIYVTNRGDDSISVYEVEISGKLKCVQKIGVSGRTPRGICITPNDKFLLIGNQDSDTVVEYERNLKTGFLEERARILVPTPVGMCVVKKRYNTFKA